MKTEEQMLFVMHIAGPFIQRLHSERYVDNWVTRSGWICKEYSDKISLNMVTLINMLEIDKGLGRIQRDLNQLCFENWPFWPTFSFGAFTPFIRLLANHFYSSIPLVFSRQLYWCHHTQLLEIHLKPNANYDLFFSPSRNGDIRFLVDLTLQFYRILAKVDKEQDGRLR